MKPNALSLTVAAAALAAAAGLRAEPPVPDTLDLKTAVGFALENNFAIRQARERIRQQEGVEITVRARQIPSLAAAGAYTGNATAISSYAPPDNDRAWSISLQARQVLYAGGGVSAAVRASGLARAAAVLELQSVINGQLLAVRTQFYTVLLGRERILVQEENVKLLEEQLKDAQNRFTAGTTSNFEVLRAEVALANGQPPLIQARNDYRVAIEQLRQLLGFATGGGPGTAKVPEFQGALEAGAPVTLQLADALAAARAHRPELQQLARLEQAGEQNVTASRATYLPEVDLVAGYSWVRGPVSATWGARNDGWTAGVQSSWSIFDGRATAGRVVQAKSQLEQARLTLADTTLAIEVQVRQAYSTLTEAWELVQASSKTVEQAQEALRLANVRYDAGTATQLDVLTSQVALTQARLNQLQAWYGYSVARAAVRQAMGEADEYVLP
ncbi:MAG TPA: TolC family protein [Opitutaceae bacterium]|nr:TolC family protein [Opitutaceae bacterium]